MNERERWDRWLEPHMGRGQLKRCASQLDEDAGLREALLNELARRGRWVPEEAPSWPGKRLLRYARDRESSARKAANLITNDQGFQCLHCGESVPPLVRTSRDHCPTCLWSRHVDIVPGDRQGTCLGAQRPMGAVRRQGAWRIQYICERCGEHSECKVAMEGDRPDVWEAVIALASLGAKG